MSKFSDKIIKYLTSVRDGLLVVQYGQVEKKVKKQLKRKNRKNKKWKHKLKNGEIVML